MHETQGARRGTQVLERLRERPPALWYAGEQVDDVTSHPAFYGGVRTLAEDMKKLAESVRSFVDLAKDEAFSAGD
jgi:aromatic ring hydroxylase